MVGNIYNLGWWPGSGIQRHFILIAVGSISPCRGLKHFFSYGIGSPSFAAPNALLIAYWQTCTGTARIAWAATPTTNPNLGLSPSLLR
jgi:hypothetical protein